MMHPSKRARGGNLIELIFTLPLVLILFLTIIELGHFWQTFEAAKLAAVDGAFTASVQGNAGAGTQTMIIRLQRANIDFNAGETQVLQQGYGYRATASVIFAPIVGNVTLPTLSGNITVIPGEITVRYTDVKSPTLY
jgi:hypothetical protein